MKLLRLLAEKIFWKCPYCGKKFIFKLSMKAHMHTEHKDEKLKIVDDLRCLKCGSEKFYRGPRGALSLNIMCAECGAKYNVLRVGNYLVMEEI